MTHHSAFVQTEVEPQPQCCGNTNGNGFFEVRILICYNFNCRPNRLWAIFTRCGNSSKTSRSMELASSTERMKVLHSSEMTGKNREESPFI